MTSESAGTTSGYHLQDKELMRQRFKKDLQKSKHSYVQIYHRADEQEVSPQVGRLNQKNSFRQLTVITQWNATSVSSVRALLD